MLPVESTASAGIVDAREVVAVCADACRRRLGLAAVAPRGGLTAGQGQWLGIAVSPLHDALQEAQLRVHVLRPGGYGFISGESSDI